MGALASRVLLQTEGGLGASGFGPAVQNLGKMVWKDLGWLECCRKNLRERRWCPRPTVSPACCAVAWCEVPVPSPAPDASGGPVHPSSPGSAPWGPSFTLSGVSPSMSACQLPICSSSVPCLPIIALCFYILPSMPSWNKIL